MKKTVIFLVGPTAVGKTELSLTLAEKLNAEIISADSRQIYKYMNIGTATPNDDELARVPHHFINILEPQEAYNAGKYSKDARLKIDKIDKLGKVSLVVGGSGLYIKALIDGFFEGAEVDGEIRKKIAADLKKYGLEILYKRLNEVDPQYAGKISINDRQRITRALEVILSSGKPLSELHQKGSKQADFEPLMYGLTMERELLYGRINQRVDKMFNDGLLDEVKGLIEKGYNADLNALNTVGYKEVFQFLEGKLSYDEAIDLIKRNSRHYAKRQLTWFRKDERIKWFNVDNSNLFNFLADRIVSDFYKEKR